ncbi:MAG: MGMT family protein [Dehalobacterium sp.]
MKSYFEKVYEIVRKIPEGKVATYGLIALMLGQPRNGRVVGWAMRKAPHEMNLPCYRVINKSGKLAADYVFGSKELQRALLEREGVLFNRDGKVDLKRCLWEVNMDMDRL